MTYCFFGADLADQVIWTGLGTRDGGVGTGREESRDEGGEKGEGGKRKGGGEGKRKGGGKEERGEGREREEKGE